MRRSRHALEYAAARILYAFFSLLPVDWASSLGGWVGRTFGPGLHVSSNARRNLKRSFPDWPSDKIEQTVQDMWDNLGRTAGEHPHLSAFDPYRANSRVDVVGAEYCDLFKKASTPGLFVGGHFANWEVTPLAGIRRGLTVHLVYRRANNPFFDRLLQKGRNTLNSDFYPKGAKGAKAILRALKRGDNLALLVDQKMNDGIAVPFLGRDAMTAPAVAELALRYNCPVVPARVERLKGAHFRVTFYPPIDRPETGSQQQDILVMMTEINRQLGEWIKEKPAQWLWVHNRWPE